jgi:hypothetical protein
VETTSHLSAEPDISRNFVLLSADLSERAAWQFRSSEISGRQPEIDIAKSATLLFREVWGAEPSVRPPATELSN